MRSYARPCTPEELGYYVHLTLVEGAAKQIMREEHILAISLDPRFEEQFSEIIKVSYQTTEDRICLFPTLEEANALLPPWRKAIHFMGVQKYMQLVFQARERLEAETTAEASQSGAATISQLSSQPRS